MKSLLGKLGVILVGLVIFGYAEVWGADWRLLHKDDKVSKYYDAESVVFYPGDVVRVTQMDDYTEKGVREEWPRELKNLKFDILLYEINCAEKKCKLLKFTLYSKEGKVIGNLEKKGIELKPWSSIKPIYPGCIEDVLYGIVCPQPKSPKSIK